VSDERRRSNSLDPNSSDAGTLTQPTPADENVQGDMLIFCSHGTT
jgi:hypothetical protein